MVYSLIAFDERITFWLQRVRSLPCACAYVALFACRLAYNHYAIAHAFNAANTHAKVVTRRVEAKNLLSRRRQSEYSLQERRKNSRLAIMYKIHTNDVAIPIPEYVQRQNI